MPTQTSAQGSERLLRVRGTVQGVGFRPFVARLAAQHGLRGWVRNDAEGVLVRAAGEPGLLDRFADCIATQAPPAARITGRTWLELNGAPPISEPGFVVLGSDRTAGEITADAPPDLGLCEDCRAELANPRDRRFRYPFLNCTRCGPRYSIIESLPYDRGTTTMRAFALCPACRKEYLDPKDRRYHAEPVACPQCGPRLVLTGPDGGATAFADNAIESAALALLSGRILAVKGVGGFHLMVDATNEAAVRDLRLRKRRDQKPFAVMYRDLDSLRGSATVSPAAGELLTSPAAPIVLLPRLAGAPIAACVAPNNPWIGALLASTPLHVRLLEAFRRPVVATSGNLSEEPLCRDDADARLRLSGIADLYLGHDRAIARPVDDSVVRLSPSGARIMLRRARGYAPSPLRLPSPLDRPTLCVGGHMKNTVALASADRIVLSPHIGDLEGVATCGVFEETVAMLGGLLRSSPQAVACDKHPSYASTRFAERSGLPRIAVQHHLAHLLAVLLEHNRRPDDVLGVIWDGTGYGEDGTIWGGEFILLRNGRATRFARLRPFRLPGGEAAIRDSRRAAVGLAAELDPAAAARVAGRLDFSARETQTLLAMMEGRLNSPVCSSAGRLFSGVGALLGLGRRDAHEGQTPLAVEIAATGAVNRPHEVVLPVRPARTGATWEIDWTPLVADLLGARTGEAGPRAAGFHRGLAEAIVAVARLAGVGSVALSGGCFQNALLRDLAETGLAAAGMTVLSPIELPANDGAIAAGQALAALWNLTTVEAPGVPAPR